MASMLKDLLKARTDTELYSDEELEKLQALIKEEVDPALQEQYRKAVQAVYLDGRIVEKKLPTWPEFLAANPNSLNLKRWFYAWWTREEAATIRAISRYYKIQPSFWASEIEPGTLAIIHYLDRNGVDEYTSFPGPSLAAGGRDERNIVHWTTKAGYRSQRPGNLPVLTA